MLWFPLKQISIVTVDRELLHLHLKPISPTLPSRPAPAKQTEVECSGRSFLVRKVPYLEDQGT